MPLREGQVVIEAAALGHFYAVIAMDPDVEFYRILKEEKIRNAQIRWAWFCLVAFSVDCWVQELTAVDSSRAIPLTHALASFWEACSAAGVSSEADLESFILQARAISEVVRARLLGGESRETAFDFGLALNESNAFNITNPARLQSLELVFWGMFHDVRAKLAHYTLV